MNPDKVTHVLYHSNCYDGFGSAWAAQQRLGKDAEYIPVLHGNPPPPLPSDAKVAIVDFSYKRDIIGKLKERISDLIILDHHQSARTDLAGLSFAIFDMNKSGAMLSWEFFHPGKPVPEFIAYLQDRDLWQFKLPQSREVSAALRAHDFDFAVWTELSYNVPRLMKEGAVVLQFTNRMVDIMSEQVQWKVLAGHKVPVANATVFFSEVGEALCNKYPQAKFAAYYMDRSDGKRQWGLRSHGFDVSEVAKYYDGGGHKQAAGFVESLDALRI